MPEDIDSDPTEDNGGVEETVEIIDEETGEAVEVDPGEAKRMGLRQADYTRKTQETAALRKEAEHLLTIQKIAEVDPVAAVNAFQQMLAQQGRLQIADDDEEDLHPLEIEQRQIRAQLESLQNEAKAAKLEAQMAQAITKHGLSVQVDELFDFMVENDIGNASTAARLMALESQGAKTQEAKSKVIAAKRSLPPVESGRGSAVPTSKTDAMSIEEAFALALKQHA